MGSERPSSQYSAPPRFSGTPSRQIGPPRFFRPTPGPSSSADSSRASQLGLGVNRSAPSRFGLLGRGTAGVGLGKGGVGGGKGKGKGKGGPKRHAKIQRDSISGVTKGDIRRLARRGGVKRISATVYSDIRVAMKERLAVILKDICAIIESSGRKTVSVADVVFALRRRGNPLYGFEPSLLKKR